MFRWQHVSSAHFSVFSFIVSVRLIVCNLDSLHLLTCYIDDAVFDWLWNLCALEMWAKPMPNVMAALPNIGGALCSMPQSFADAHYQSAVQ